MYKLIVLKDFLDRESEKSAISITAGFKYILNSDLALCLLLGNGRNLSEVEFAAKENISVNIKICISGHPGFTSKERIYPGLVQNCHLRKKLKQHFFGYKCLVNSFGHIKNGNDEIIELLCSGIHGMSGASILLYEEKSDFTNRIKIVGTSVGGPPLPGQQELYESINRFSNNGNYEEIKEKCQQFATNYERFYRINPFTLLNNNLAGVNYDYLREDLKTSFYSILERTTRENLQLLEGDKNIYFNCGVPC